MAIKGILTSFKDKHNCFYPFSILKSDFGDTKTAVFFWLCPVATG